jgi:TolB protein
MIKKIILSICVFVLICNISFAQKKMAFERTGTIYLYSFDDNSETKLFDGYQHSISPDGNAIAFTETDSMGNRYIGVYKIQPAGILPLTPDIIRYTAVPGQNSYEPKYSPDGKNLVFNYWNSNDWDIAIVSADNSNYVNLTEPYRVSTGFTSGFYSPSWSPDSKSIVTHDMSNVYEFDLQGNILNKYPMTKVLTDAKIYPSSASMFTYNKDKTHLIFDGENEMFFENLEEPVNGIYSYDIKNNSIKMISSMDYSSIHPVISYAGNKIYYSAFGKKDITVKKSEELDSDYYEIRYSIYTMNMNGGNVTKIIEDAYSPSITN